MTLDSSEYTDLICGHSTQIREFDSKTDAEKAYHIELAQKHNNLVVMKEVDDGSIETVEYGSVSVM